MPVQVSYKFDESPVKNELRRFLVNNIFLYNKTIGNIFDAQEQVTSRCLALKSFIPAFVHVT